MSKKKREWSRDTKFKRYAAQVWQDIESAFRVEGIRIDRYHDSKPGDVARDVLAKRLYDFADHATSHTEFTFAKDIPDLSKDD